MSVVTLSFNAVALLGTCAIDCRNFGLLTFRSVEESAIAITRQTSTVFQSDSIQNQWWCMVTMDVYRTDRVHVPAPEG